MTKETLVKIGKKEVNVGLDFSFGFLLILKRFGLGLADFNTLSSGDANQSFDFISKIVQAAHIYYCEQNDEEPVLTNESKVLKAVTEIGIETVTEWLTGSMDSFAPSTESDATQEKKALPLPS